MNISKMPLILSNFNHFCNHLFFVDFVSFGNPIVANTTDFVYYYISIPIKKFDHFEFARKLGCFIQSSMSDYFLFISTYN